MPKETNHLESVVALTTALEQLGLSPVLVGGMALVILGSQRITNDFDFLISLREPLLAEVVSIFYDHGFELVSKLNPQGEAIRTIDNRNVAAARLKLDSPSSAYFFDRKKGLRIDLLFDFPLSTYEVASRATRFKIPSGSLRIASTEDLLRLKELAFADRRAAADAQDVEFLRRLLGKGEIL
ncbi:MAG: hypothetical protein HYV03_00270 [Deltaproteobacteria bacterium]|nr:hypothetical protein [Deltaproteobacteria bacterium]